MVASKNKFKKISYALLIISAILMVCTDVWAAASNSKPAMVNRIDFIAGEKGTSTLIIGTTADIKYDLQLEDDNKMRLVLENTVIPTYRRRVLVTSNFDSAINRILPVQSQEGNDAYVLIDLREKVPYKIDKTAENITISFEASTAKAAPVAAASEEFSQQNMMASVNTGNKITGSISSPQRIETTNSSRTNIVGVQDTTLTYGTVKKAYTGTPIALDFYETDIRNVIRILQEVSGRNFAVDRDVQGSVTLSFKKPVPWDQVLDLILTMNQLSYIDDGGIIRIARVQTLTRESEDRTMAVNRANALRDAETKATAFIPVYYAKAVDLAETHIEPWLEELRDKLEDSTGDSNLGTDITVTADSRLNMLVVNAPERIVEQVRGIVQNLDRVTPQVLIEARIIEANSTFSRELGVNWENVTLAGLNIFGGSLDLDLSANNIPSSFSVKGGGSAGFSLKNLGKHIELIDATISAGESEGLTNILSAPRILTLNTEKATIKQGLEVPYEERDDSGGATISFKNVDLLLEVTPQITLDNRITLEIYITKNEVANFTYGNNIFPLITNEARTKFMVDNGDTVVIGGILKTTRTNNETGVPGLRNLSLLGWLFQSERITEEKNELLIFMTPTIITLEGRGNSSL